MASTTRSVASGVEMNQRHLYRLAVGRQRSVEPPPVSGSLGQAKPTLAPQDASNFLNQMLLGGPLRSVLGHERRYNRLVFVGILPGQDCPAGSIPTCSSMG
jgi:hypothetical protein